MPSHEKSSNDLRRERRPHEHRRRSSQDRSDVKMRDASTQTPSHWTERARPKRSQAEEGERSSRQKSERTPAPRETRCRSSIAPPEQDVKGTPAADPDIKVIQMPKKGRRRRN